ncbi:hypothetical protein EDD86DRAFT_84341 [Gorgonomyces haynaldii]|nr:hypothetical protein EDD86DRAFT_84341 [Gorgonomyces haynaldii]
MQKVLEARIPKSFKVIHPRPLNIHPTTFRQTVVHSDGSTFSIRTTSPKSITVLVKDTLNHPLWNPRSVVVDDSFGQISKFGQRFGNLSEFDSLVDDKVVTVGEMKPKRK